MGFIASFVIDNLQQMSGSFGYLKSQAGPAGHAL